MAAALHRFWLADVCWNDYLTTSKNWSFSDIRASRGISRTEMRTGSRLFVLKGPQSSSTRCVFICSQQRSVYLPGSWIEFCDDIFPCITEGATCPRWFQGCAESTLSSSQHLLQLVAPAPFLSLCPWCWKPPFYPETSISIYTTRRSLKKARKAFFWIELLSAALRALLGLFGDNTLSRCDGLLKFRDTTDLLKTRLNGALFSFGNNWQDIRG